MTHLNAECDPTCLADTSINKKPCENCYNNPKAPRTNLTVGAFEVILDYKRTVVVGPNRTVIREDK